MAWLLPFRAPQSEEFIREMYERTGHSKITSYEAYRKSWQEYDQQQEIKERAINSLSDRNISSTGLTNEQANQAVQEEIERLAGRGKTDVANNFKSGKVVEFDPDTGEMKAYSYVEWLKK